MAGQRAGDGRGREEGVSRWRRAGLADEGAVDQTIVVGVDDAVEIGIAVPGVFHQHIVDCRNREDGSGVAAAVQCVVVLTRCRSVGRLIDRKPLVG